MVYTEPVSGEKWGEVGNRRPLFDKNKPEVGSVEHMFLGEYAHTIDDKGRLTLPAKYRAELASGVVVTRGIDKCLFVFPMDEWKKLSDKVSACRSPIRKRAIFAACFFRVLPTPNSINKAACYCRSICVITPD